MTSIADTATRTTDATETDPRSRYIAGLRKLAEVLEQKPDLPKPTDGAAPYPTSISVWAKSREDMQAWADVLTDVVEKPSHTGSSYQLHGRLDGLYLYVWAEPKNLGGREIVREETVFVVEPFLPAAVSA